MERETGDLRGVRTGKGKGGGERERGTQMGGRGDRERREGERSNEEGKARERGGR